ncbi:DUF6114 domain-containing protein [Streptomyces sp. L7]
MSDNLSRQGMRPAFRHWRAGRPFWGGLLLALGGSGDPAHGEGVAEGRVHIGMQGMTGYLLPVLMVLLGLLILFSPSQRLFLLDRRGPVHAGLLADLEPRRLLRRAAAEVVVGSCLAFGWLPDQEEPLVRKRATAPG